MEESIDSRTSEEQSSPPDGIDGSLPTATQDRHVVIAVWEERSKLVNEIEPNDVKFATKVEEEADEAICVTVEDDGAITISRSKHSVGRSLALLTVKLMIALPIGLHGTVAMATAATEIEAAVRKREYTDFEEEELSFLVEQMKPGWSAVIAVYAEIYVPAAVEGLLAMQAAMVWHAPESQIESVVRSSDIDIDRMEPEGIPATRGGVSRNAGDKKTVCSMLCSSFKPVCCLCTSCIAAWAVADNL